ncbi:MAG: porin family protein [Myxococcota bacterium]|nr:porin family protein [Myxococcota bacterium]
MTNRILPAAVSVLAVAAALLAPSTRAEAQCRPDDIFCAELRIGPAQPPPPPQVYVPPPQVYVPPPQVYVPPPQPPVVIVQPAQPQPPPQIVVVRPPPQARPPVVAVQVQRRRAVRELVPEFDLGFHINLAGLMTENVHMGGVQGAFRLRPVRHLAIDIGAGIFGGESLNYGGNGGRWEVPVNLDLLFFFNPQHRFQVYALVGAGVSVAGQEMSSGRERELEYVGGQAGLGFEWRIARRFALNLDMRGFLRQHVGDDGPEFSRVSETGDVESTDLSGGFYGTIGMTFYFGR